MVDNILGMVGRTKPLFEEDIRNREAELSDIIKNSRFLVIGGAGTIDRILRLICTGQHQN